MTSTIIFFCYVDKLWKVLKSQHVSTFLKLTGHDKNKGQNAKNIPQTLVKDIYQFQLII